MQSYSFLFLFCIVYKIKILIYAQCNVIIYAQGNVIIYAQGNVIIYAQGKANVYAHCNVIFTVISDLLLIL
jgi:hypothetical protein